MHPGCCRVLEVKAGLMGQRLSARGKSFHAVGDMLAPSNHGHQRLKILRFDPSRKTRRYPEATLTSIKS